MIRLLLNKTGKYLDYGAGYGIFVRMMRDIGFDFWGYDSYAASLFSKQFDIKNNTHFEQKFDAITCFEVFEHLENPNSELQKMLAFSDTIIFSTSLSDYTYKIKGVDGLKNWWYISEETGQHISFYTYKSLEILAKKYNLNFYSNRYNFHLFTKKTVNPFLFMLIYVFKNIKNLLANNTNNQTIKDREKLKIVN